MEPIVLPIAGVAANHPEWQEILNAFKSHMNPAATKTRLQKLFRNPAHCGYLASLLLMKQILLSPDSYWRNLGDLKRTILSLITTLAKLLDLGGDATPRGIFTKSKARFMDELMESCGCYDCRNTIQSLDTFTEGGRLPRLSPHVQECKIESLLLSIHMNAAMLNKLAINEEHLAALLMDPRNYEDFENKTAMAILASILHVCSLFFLVDKVEKQLFAEVEDELVKIISLEDATPFSCSSKRALDMIKSHGDDGFCQRVTLPHLPTTKSHLPPPDGAALSKSLLQKLNHVLNMGSSLSISSEPLAVDPPQLPLVVEEPILKEVSMPCYSNLPESGKRHHKLRQTEKYLSGRGDHHRHPIPLPILKKVTPSEDDPIAVLNRQLSDLNFAQDDDTEDGHQEELSSLFTKLGEDYFRPLDLLNGVERWEELAGSPTKDLGSWMINSSLVTKPRIKGPTQGRGGDKKRTKQKKPNFVNNPYFRV